MKQEQRSQLECIRRVLCYDNGRFKDVLQPHTSFSPFCKKLQVFNFFPFKIIITVTVIQHCTKVINRRRKWENFAYITFINRHDTVVNEH